MGLCANLIKRGVQGLVRGARIRRDSIAVPVNGSACVCIFLLIGYASAPIVSAVSRRPSDSDIFVKAGVGGIKHLTECWKLLARVVQRPVVDPNVVVFAR